jgi:hypothetical protein
MWWKYYVYMNVNGKMRLLNLFQEWVGVGIKENSGKVNSSMIYLIHYKNFVNATMYHQHNDNK